MAEKKPAAKSKKSILPEMLVGHDGKMFVSLADAAKILGIAVVADEPVKTRTVNRQQKGYVKCLLRKTVSHSHQQDIRYGATLISAIIAWFVTLLTTVGFMTAGSEISFGWYPPTGYCLVAAIVLSVVAIDLDSSNDERTYGYTGDKNNSDAMLAIERWKPPACKNREDCE